MSLRAARRVEQGRDSLSPDAVELLLHMAQTGPATLADLSRYLERAQSTLSARVASLEAGGLLSRQRDGQDPRRLLVWLSPSGRRALAEAMEMLDTACLAAAAASWDDERRRRLVDELDALLDAMPPLDTRAAARPRAANDEA
nr:MarR family winged helix-turn-helix transcriptional regulator [Rubrivivax gelatinosus]